MTNSKSAPHDRYCDLVMKGGITSGIIYPPLAARLAKRYRFKNIGGTSAGAIAAVATAAAEYRRRKNEDEGVVAFEKLSKLPHMLKEKLPCGSMTKLLSLFQPSPGCHRLFKVLLISMNASGAKSRIGRVIAGFLYAYWPATLISIAIAVLIIWHGNWTFAAVFFGAMISLLTFVILIGCCVCCDINRHLAKNNYGMCTGMTISKCGHEALTPWLHGLIQDLAGLEKEGKPLTFGDLWGADGYPPEWIELPKDAKKRSIDLRMFTTNLSHGRPYVLPLTDEKTRLFYLPKELAPFLPKNVMDWILDHSKCYEPDSGFPGSEPPAHVAPEGLMELPLPEDFPVLLAARMSLSFPLLFSAIPLWAIDYDCPEEERTLQRCIFSDGGISSNFPIHMFDGLLPAWPTFGVQLEPKLTCRPNMTYLPTNYFYGWGERWNRFAGGIDSPAPRMGGFFMAMISTMQEWNDNTLSRMPGVRDRVVRIRLNEKEGGLNLNMDPEIITELASRGEDAAEMLIARFAPVHGSGTPAVGWDDQRWIRFGVLLDMLHKYFIGLGLTLSAENIHSTPFEELIRQGLKRQLPGEGNLLTPDQVTALLNVIESMKEFNTDLILSSPYSFKSIPEPDLRVRPSL